MSKNILDVEAEMRYKHGFSDGLALGHGNGYAQALLDINAHVQEGGDVTTTFLAKLAKKKQSDRHKEKICIS